MRIFGTFAPFMQPPQVNTKNLENPRNNIVDSFDGHHYVRNNKGKKLGYTLWNRPLKGGKNQKCSPILFDADADAGLENHGHFLLRMHLNEVKGS